MSGEGTVNGSVGTTAKVHRFTTQAGATLLLRRAKNSDQTTIASVVNFNGQNDSSAMRFAQALFLWGVVGAEGVLDDDGNPVKFRLEPFPGLGRVACMAIYDAATSEDVVGVMAYVTSRPQLSEAQEGN